MTAQEVGLFGRGVNGVAVGVGDRGGRGALRSFTFVAGHEVSIVPDCDICLTLSTTEFAGVEWIYTLLSGNTFAEATPRGHPAPHHGCERESPSARRTGRGLE